MYSLGRGDGIAPDISLVPVICQTPGPRQQTWLKVESIGEPGGCRILPGGEYHGKDEGCDRKDL